MIVRLDDLLEVRHRHKDQKIALTSGTFDLFHVGHLNYLQEVQKHGDVVLVLLSGDARVKARKGSKRPIINEHDRARIIDSLKVVDYVLIDPSQMSPEEKDPVHAVILDNLEPDFYVTDGPDPRFYGLMDKSKFIILDRLNPEPSTTSIIEHIRKLDP